MFDKLRQMLGSPREKPAQGPVWTLPPGQRVYAIGDVHGRRDLFDALVAAIEADDAARGPAETTIILLGDLVDRGPESAGMLAAASALAARRKVRIIAGNHEEMFLDSFDSDDVLREFLRHGGRETILSYNVDPDHYRELTIPETRDLLHQVIPEADAAFMRSFEDRIVIGDYLFVHAGIKPQVPLTEQTPAITRWIRREFIEYRGDHGWCVVHGHTIMNDPSVTPNRIGIDTGAYMTGRLTALGLEGTQRWFLCTEESMGGSVAVAPWQVN